MGSIGSSSIMPMPKGTAGSARPASIDAMSDFLTVYDHITDGKCTPKHSEFDAFVDLVEEKCIDGVANDWSHIVSAFELS